MMYDLGYTGLKKDADGNLLKEIDWSTTKAIATRECYIWINLKGENATGIVDPKDKYFLEQQIIVTFTATAIQRMANASSVWLCAEKTPFILA